MQHGSRNCRFWFDVHESNHTDSNIDETKQSKGKRLVPFASVENVINVLSTSPTAKNTKCETQVKDHQFPLKNVEVGGLFAVENFKC